MQLVQTGSSRNSARAVADRALASALSSANDAALSDARRRLREGDASAEASRTVPELARHLVASGFHDPTLQMYVAAPAKAEWALLAFAFTLASLPLYRYDETVAALAPKKNGAAGDPTPAIVGLLTFLRQFHVSHVRTYLRLMGQHLRVAASERREGLKRVEAGFGGRRGSARRGWRRSASTRTCRGGTREVRAGVRAR